MLLLKYSVHKNQNLSAHFVHLYQYLDYKEMLEILFLNLEHGHEIYLKYINLQIHFVKVNNMAVPLLRIAAYQKT